MKDLLLNTDMIVGQAVSDLALAIVHCLLI